MHLLCKLFGHWYKLIAVHNGCENSQCRLCGGWQWKSPVIELESKFSLRSFEVGDLKWVDENAVPCPLPKPE